MINNNEEDLVRIAKGVSSLSPDNHDQVNVIIALSNIESAKNIKESLDQLSAKISGSSYALETTIEKRGFLFTDKVAVVRSKKTREVVAEVKMDTQGFIFDERVAVATNIKTKEKISKTFESVDGFLFPERTATTKDYKTNTATHITKIVEEGFLFPERFSETRSVDHNDSTVTRSKENTRGIIFKENYVDTNKKKP